MKCLTVFCSIPNSKCIIYYINARKFDSPTIPTSPPIAKILWSFKERRPSMLTRIQPFSVSRTLPVYIIYLYTRTYLIYIMPVNGTIMVADT